MAVADRLGKLVELIQSRVGQELQARALEASMALRGAGLRVLRGRRSGRRYRIPTTKRYYTASAPGEPPAVRTGVFRLSWQVAPDGIVPGINTRYGKLAGWLEEGTRKMKPRPYVERIKAAAWPQVQRIYRRPYLGG